MFFSFLKKYLPNDEQKFLKGWRENLSDFEIKILIPGFEGRIKHIISILERMQHLCTEERSNQILPHLFNAIHNQLGIPCPAPEEIAKAYIDKFYQILEDDFLVDAREILKKFDPPITLNKHIEILVAIKNYCHSVLAVKGKTFSFLIGFGGVILDNKGDYVKTVEPTENAIIWHPFNHAYNELCSIAQSTLESIQAWESDQVKVKESFLNFKSHLYQFRVFILSIIFTTIFSIAISWLFFVSNDHLKLSQYELELNANNELIKKLQNDLTNNKTWLKYSKDALMTCREEATINPKTKTTITPQVEVLVHGK